MLKKDDDDWITEALTDTNVVAHLIVKLRQPPPQQQPPLSWTIRRSRTNKSEEQPPRASPSTPLSWNGNGGAAAVADVRSKVAPPGETTPTKRPRKKKTLAVLKEEEALLMEEQKQLKRKLAALQFTREKQRKENESLKQMKLDIQPGRQVVRPKAIRYDEIQRLNSHFEVINERNDKFVLPDLNVPVGEDVIMSY